MSRPGVIVLLLVTPLLLAAARDPRGDVTSCADGSTATDPVADLVEVDAFADELGSAAVWRLTFAAPLPVPDREGAPLRIDVLVRDPKLPTVALGDERGLNRLVRWDDTSAEQPIDIVAKVVVVDPKSALYVSGSELDYVDALQGGGFKVNNPNAATTCSCGESFSA